MLLTDLMIFTFKVAFEECNDAIDSRFFHNYAVIAIILFKSYTY